MKTKNLILISLAIFTFTSCNFSFSENKKMQTKRKTIEGVDYMFSNYTEYKNIKVSFVEVLQLKNKISFSGMEESIEKLIYKSDFEKKIDFKNIEFIHIDSISFLVNDQKDKIDLIYYLNLGNQTKSVMFALQKDNETWNLK